MKTYLPDAIKWLMKRTRPHNLEKDTVEDHFSTLVYITAVVARLTNDDAIKRSVVLLHNRVYLKLNTDHIYMLAAVNVSNARDHRISRSNLRKASIADFPSGVELKLPEIKSRGTDWVGFTTELTSDWIINTTLKNNSASGVGYNSIRSLEAMQTVLRHPRMGKPLSFTRDVVCLNSRDRAYFFTHAIYAFSDYGLVELMLIPVGTTFLYNIAKMWFKSLTKKPSRVKKNRELLYEISICMLLFRERLPESAVLPANFMDIMLQFLKEGKAKHLTSLHKPPKALTGYYRFRETGIVDRKFEALHTHLTALHLFAVLHRIL